MRQRLLTIGLALPKTRMTSGFVMTKSGSSLQPRSKDSHCPVRPNGAFRGSQLIPPLNPPSRICRWTLSCKCRQGSAAGNPIGEYCIREVRSRAAKNAYLTADEHHYKKKYLLRSDEQLIPIDKNFPAITRSLIYKINNSERIKDVSYQIDVGGLGFPKNSKDYELIFQPKGTNVNA